MNKKIYIIWIGWIWISDIARYYLYQKYEVFWSDQTNSELIEKLQSEWCNIIIWKDKNRISNIFEKIVYTEAVPKEQEEFLRAKELNIQIQTYPEALAEIANNKKLIAITWTHWKSTTTSLTSLVLKNSITWTNAVVWTILKEFEWKNTYFSNSEYFTIEACEYKRSFLVYKPFIAIITNIDLDHLDYYKDLEDYLSAFEEYINNVRVGGFVILNWDDKNCNKLVWIRNDINYIEIYEKYATFTNINWDSEIITFPKINMKVPWNHILFDAYIAYIVGYMLKIENNNIIQTLENYTWVWRRMEIIWKTENNNVLMSDYWHHPTEIKLTLKALKDQNPERPILTIFQPHQYNRTLELLEEFKTCFYNTDKLIVPNIYESRDSDENKKKINSKIFIENIKHNDKIDWETFEKTLELINKWDKNNSFWIILLMWAWDIDNLRHKIKTN
jgi:UDP-N-acetylmuramate--alanine ligase